MTRLELLTDKRFELINKLIELKTWQMSNPQAKADQAIAQVEQELDSLDKKINKLINE